MSALALGTAQFGMHYGISNTRGKIPPEEACRILTYAAAQGIRMLDTARAYGDSEDVVGEIVFQRRLSMALVTKVRGETPASLEDELTVSLRKLRVGSVYGCLLHDFASFRRCPDIWRALETIRTRGLSERIGFSIYHPEEWELIESARVTPDIVQVPLNVFDRRFVPYLARIRRHGAAIHIRSVFLQGLAFREPETLPPFFAPAQRALRKLRRIARETATTIPALCLAFVRTLHPDVIIVGVDSLEHLRQLLDAYHVAATLSAAESLLEECAVGAPEILLPYRWPATVRS